MRIYQLAKELNLDTKKLIQKLKEFGIEVKSHMSSLDKETVEIIKEELRGNKSERQQPKEKLSTSINSTINYPTKIVEKKITPRSPVITLMGHVDHGKTSLLDAIRNSYVVRKEKGGITQHIGAYRVKLKKGAITFLDTPGHQAFTAMRAQGASIADIVILVIAANEGIKPQTVEAIDHARAAKVAIMVAINKIDIPSADIEKVKKDLQKLGLTPEEWGGETIVVKVSAKTKEGIGELLEMALLQAEMLELKADFSGLARGVIIEGKVSPGRGVATTVLVQNGKLELGNIVVSDCYYGKIKAIIDEQGKRLKEAFPSMAVEILGLSGISAAGNFFYVVDNEKKAKEICWRNQEKKAKERLTSKQKISLENLYQQLEQKEIKELKLVVKADVHGSLEALGESLEKLSTSRIKVNIIHQATGGINESDIILAAVSNAVVIGFHIRASLKAEELASREGVEIKLYDIIYEVIADVKASLEGLLEPIVKEVVVGKAEVRQVFKISKMGTIAGCFLHKGKVKRNDQVHLIRDNTVIYEGKIKSLKRFKNDAREVEEGFECGIGLYNYDDIKVGDFIEAYEKEEVAQKLE